MSQLLHHLNYHKVPSEFTETDFRDTESESNILNLTLSVSFRIDVLQASIHDIGTSAPRSLKCSSPVTILHPFSLAVARMMESIILQTSVMEMTGLLNRESGLLPTIVVAETVRHLCEKRGIEEAEIRHFLLVRSGLFIADLTGEIAREAGLLKCGHPNVPTGDCIVASTALARKAKILSDDKHFDEIRSVSRIWI